MKIKAWHGILVLLVAVALYFFISTREGLDNPSCWEDPVDGGIQDPVTNETKFVSGAAMNSFMSKKLPTIMACYGGSFPPPGTQPTSSQIDCIKKLMYSSLDEAKAACALDSSCTAVLSSPAGNGDSYSKFTEDASIVPTGGARYPGQKIYVKKPCANSSSPTLTAMPPGPTGTTGGASMTPSTVPTASTTSSPSYNFMCTASPVSGMTGSVGMPETPPIWDVNQPPPGHNSKHGYTLYG